MCWAGRTLGWLPSLQPYPLARARSKSSSEISKLGLCPSLSEADTRSSPPSSSLSSSLSLSLHSSATCDLFAPGSSSSTPLLVLVLSESLVGSADLAPKRVSSSGTRYWTTPSAAPTMIRKVQLEGWARFWLRIRIDGEPVTFVSPRLSKAAEVSGERSNLKKYTYRTLFSLSSWDVNHSKLQPAFLMPAPEKNVVYTIKYRKQMFTRRYVFAVTGPCICVIS